MNGEKRDFRELTGLCTKARSMIERGQDEACWQMLCSAMGQYPDRAEPHNLMGILLEHLGDQPGAMRHFRAAWALDPTYKPAGCNLQVCGSFPRTAGLVWENRDCPEEKETHQPVIFRMSSLGKFLYKAG